MTIHNPMKRLAVFILKKLARVGFVYPIVKLCAKDITSHQDCTDEKRITILALNPDRFRGDLDCLASTQKYRILKMPFNWQGRFHNWFYKKNRPHSTKLTEDILEKRQREYHVFLKAFLPKLFSYLKIDIVIGAAIHYQQDYDIAKIAHEIGTPTFILHREGNLASQEIKKFYEQRCYNYKKFHATHLIVQNEVQKKISISTGYVTEDQCSSVGIMRMDSFLEKIRNTSKKNIQIKKDRKKVTFFSFGPGTGILTSRPNNWPHDEENFLNQFCKKTHLEIIQYALDNPGTDILIKPKWGGNWVDHIHRIAKSKNIDLQNINNLKIDYEVNVHKLLFSSDVIIGFGSTTLLEASILGLPVIMPLYEEARQEKWQGWIQYGDWLDCFDIANTPEHLTQLINKRLENATISTKMMDIRKKAFETFVSKLDSSAIQKTTELFDNHLQNSNKLQTLSS